MRSCGVIVLLLLFAAPLQAQTCPQPPVLQSISSQDNMFSDQQEADLGDAMAGRLEIDLRMVHDDQLNQRLRQLGDGLIQFLPPSRLRFQFVLVESPMANAFSISGGHVYVTRKLIALARNDDEVAGVLAHELGHIVTHQSAIQMTQAFRGIGIQKVGDRADVFSKFHQFLDTLGRNKAHLKNEYKEQQYAADQVALYAMARAGHGPQAYVDILDRLQDTGGKTGNWWTDFIGSTKPEQRRLREMVHAVAGMPAACTAVISTQTTEDFKKWQEAVIAFHKTTLDEALPGLIRKTQLALPLRPDIVALRFSADGKYVFAQDDGGIHVLSRDPLAPLFFIDAADAMHVSFSPDSRSIVFSNRNLRVEMWDIASQKLASAHEVIVQDGCSQTALSPDGKFLACLNLSALKLLDVVSGEVIATRKDFVILDYWDWFTYVLNLAEGKTSFFFAHMAFSPDARYFLAGRYNVDYGFDLSQRKEYSFPSSIRHVAHHSFAFVGSDRIAGIDSSSPKKSPVLRFPSGEKLAELPLSTTIWLEPVTRGNSFIVGPLRDYPLGLLDIGKRDVVAGFTQHACDAYDNLVLHETKEGQLAVSDLEAKRTLGEVQLIQSSLGRLHSATVSDDLNWLAISTHSRGAVWDVSRNIRTARTRRFDASWFDPGNVLYVDAPDPDKDKEKSDAKASGGDKDDDKTKHIPRTIARLDPLGNPTVAYTVGDTVAVQRGSYLLITKRANQKSFEDKNTTIEIFDYRTKTTVWSRFFPKETPRMTLNYEAGTALLLWPVSTAAARAEIQNSPGIAGRAEKEDYFLQLVDIRNNTTVGKLLVSTNRGSFSVKEFYADHDLVAIAASGDRVLTYSLSTGEQKGHFFGTAPGISATSGLVGFSTNSNAIDLYDFATSQLRHHYQFPVAPAGMRFSSDGKRLFVLTRDQTAYLLDLAVN